MLPFVLSVTFAAAYYVIHDPEPSLSVDHVACLKLAEEIRAEFPLGDYWTSFNSVRATGSFSPTFWI